MKQNKEGKINIWQIGKQKNGEKREKMKIHRIYVYYFVVVLLDNVKWCEIQQKLKNNSYNQWKKIKLYTWMRVRKATNVREKLKLKRISLSTCIEVKKQSEIKAERGNFTWIGLCFFFSFNLTRKKNQRRRRRRKKKSKTMSKKHKWMMGQMQKWVSEVCSVPFTDVLNVCEMHFITKRIK